MYMDGALVPGRSRREAGEGSRKFQCCSHVPFFACTQFKLCWADKFTVIGLRCTVQNCIIHLKTSIFIIFKYKFKY